MHDPAPPCPLGDGPAGRRRFLARTGGTLAGALSLALLPGEHAGAAPRLGRYPFTLGVASGDPSPDGAVLWTRLAPDPLSAGDGGMPDRRFPVRWEVATDAAMGRVVRAGLALAMPNLAHSVHVEVDGLAPGREYFYRFAYREDESVVGRFRTAPARDDAAGRLDFGFCSCQAWEDGYFTAMADMAAQDLDLVFHLGDYIYEYAIGANARGVELPAAYGEQLRTLEQYRLRHALYKTDTDLQRAHAASAFAHIWDDHELENDYVGQDPYYTTEAYLAQRAAAYQAFYEHLPLRAEARPRGPDMRLYRRLRWGTLAEFSLLDTRQHRTPPACGYGEQPACADRFETPQTMLGRDQENWLNAGLERASARWNVLAQQVLMAELFHTGDGGGDRYWTDSWDGFPAARRRLVRRIEEVGLPNPVVLTGDWHSTFVNDVKTNFERERLPPVATEFVTPSITTGGDGTPYGPYYGPFVPYNPHIKYFDGDRRGWWRARLTPERMRLDLRLLSTVASPAGIASVERSFVVEDGRPGALPA